MHINHPVALPPHARVAVHPLMESEPRGLLMWEKRFARFDLPFCPPTSPPLSSCSLLDQMARGQLQLLRHGQPGCLPAGEQRLVTGEGKPEGCFRAPDQALTDNTFSCSFCQQITRGKEAAVVCLQGVSDQRL